MDTSPLPLVIVPLDGSALAERALRPAADIASRADTGILLLSARFGPDDGTRLDYLRRTAATMHVPCDTDLVQDRLAHNAILDAARATPGALVVMSTHGHSAWAAPEFPDNGFVASAITERLSAPAIRHGPAPTAPEIGELRQLRELRERSLSRRQGAPDDAFTGASDTTGWKRREHSRCPMAFRSDRQTGPLTRRWLAFAQAGLIVNRLIEEEVEEGGVSLMDDLSDSTRGACERSPMRLRYASRCVLCSPSEQRRTTTDISRRPSVSNTPRIGRLSTGAAKPDR